MTPTPGTPLVTTANNTLVVHDSEYTMTAAYKAGALAFRSSIPNNCNPHRFHSQAHDDWDFGHVNDSAGEHFRFGSDVLAAPRRSQRFEMDPQVPRIDGGDVDDDWVHGQRKALLLEPQRKRPS